MLRAEVGPEEAPTVVLHGHLDVVPGRPGQFDPRVDGDRLYGRGAYDMKGALAAMLLTTAAMRDQDRVRVRLGIVGDEESEEEVERGSDHLVDSGFVGDFAITGEPTDLQIGVEAKGVLALRLEVSGVAAHGATPWLGDNAVLQGASTFSAASSRYRLRGTARSCSTALRSTSAGSWVATRSTRCPTDARSTSTSATCPTRTPPSMLEQVRGLPDAEVTHAVHPAAGGRRPRLCPSCGRCATRPRPIIRASR